MPSRLGNWVDSEVEDSYFVLLVEPLLFFMHVTLSSRLKSWDDNEIEQYYFVLLVDPLLFSCTFSCLLTWETGLIVS